MTKFKTGQTVQIIDNTNLRSFTIGEKVTIIITDPLSEYLRYYVENKNGIGQWTMEKEIDFTIN